MADDLFSSDALAAQLQKLDDLPKNQGGIGVVAQNGDIGVEGQIRADLGKGVFVAGDGSWMRRTGYRVAAMLGWRKKS